jgi:hypothetical protein
MTLWRTAADRLRQKARLAWRRATRRARFALMARRDLRDFRAHDDDENRPGHVPLEEHLEVHCLWVVECYPPSKSEALIKGLRDLGIGEGAIGARPAVDAWVRRYRSTAYGGGSFFPLGLFDRARGRFIGPDIVVTDLPDAVDYAHGWLEILTPSLTTVTMQFVLTDDAAHLLERALNKDYMTTAQTTRHGITFHNPTNQRREAVHDAITDLTADCCGWFRSHLPGSFSAGLLDGGFPSCVFVSTDQTDPFVRPDAPDWDSWMGAIGFDRDHEAWDSMELPGLKLRAPFGVEDDRRWWLAGRRGSFLVDNHQAPYGGNTRQGWANRLQHYMNGLLALHGATALLEGLHAAVAQSRDTMRSQQSRKWDLRRLDALRDDVTTFVRDVDPIAAELETANRLERHRADFVPSAGHILLFGTPPSPSELAPGPRSSRIARLLQWFTPHADVTAATPKKPEPAKTLADYWAGDIRWSAGRLLAAERQTRDALSTISSLIGAVESIRLDRRILVLTVVLGLATVAAALPSLAQVVRFVAKHAFGVDLNVGT